MPFLQYFGMQSVTHPLGAAAGARARLTPFSNVLRHWSSNHIHLSVSNAEPLMKVLLLEESFRRVRYYCITVLYCKACKCMLWHGLEAHGSSCHCSPLHVPPIPPHSHTRVHSAPWSLGASRQRWYIDSSQIPLSQPTVSGILVTHVKGFADELNAPSLIALPRVLQISIWQM